MRVFLAGGTGVVGQRLIPRLVDAGHDVVATTRSPGKADELRRAGAQAVVVDGLDETAVVQAVSRTEPGVVIHEMTALAGATDLRRWDRWFATTNELRTTGTDSLIRAAQLGGARRFIAQSFTGWPNIREGGPVKSEADPLDPRPPAAMRGSLEAIRYLERVVGDAQGLEGIVLRYGTLYGPATMDDYAEMLRRRKLPIIGDGAGSGRSCTSTTRPPRRSRPSTRATRAPTTWSTTTRPGCRSGSLTSPSWSGQSHRGGSRRGWRVPPPARSPCR